MSGWQPIETAPVNESVLIYIPKCHNYGAGVFRAVRIDMGNGPWWMTIGHAVERAVEEPWLITHWMPLPAPPEP